MTCQNASCVSRLCRRPPSSPANCLVSPAVCPSHAAMSQHPSPPSLGTVSAPCKAPAQNHPVTPVVCIDILHDAAQVAVHPPTERPLVYLLHGVYAHVWGMRFEA